MSVIKNQPATGPQTTTAHATKQPPFAPLQAAANKAAAQNVADKNKPAGPVPPRIVDSNTPPRKGLVDSKKSVGAIKSIPITVAVSTGGNGS